MKNKIYLSEEGKKEIEEKLSVLNKLKSEPRAIYSFPEYVKLLNTLIEILSSTIILSEKPNYTSVEDIITEEHGSVIRTNYLFANYPNGIIINLKQ